MRGKNNEDTPILGKGMLHFRKRWLELWHRISNDHINLTMLDGFRDHFMVNGYFANGFKDTIGYLICFSAKCRRQDLPLWQAWSSCQLLEELFV